MVSDTLEDIAKGATKGLLEYTEDKIKQLAQRFKDGKIAFIQNPEIIEAAKEQKKTSEYNFFQKYVTDESLRILFQMGLTLRRIEKNKKQWNNLRDRILKKYKVEGLHISQFVQNGLFNRYFAIIVERGLTDEQISEEIKDFFDNIEITSSYIQNTTIENKEVTAIISRINCYLPYVYIICGSKLANQKMQTDKR